ncbi:MAG: sulfurtransferase, partial [Caulobacteraceae bacterium]
MTADPMVSTEWLAARLDDPSVKLLDATWRMPGDPADPRADFEAGRISGAQFFAIDEIADRSTDLPHMAPSPEQFAEAVGALGISNANTVVVYDQLGLFSAARVWWTFRLFGHERVFVLDSGLPKWLAEERPVVSGSLEKPAAAAYRTRLEPRLVKSLDDVRTALASNSPNIADARPAPRFCGEQAEPRPGLRPGHMPGAHSLPFGQLINPDGTLKSAEDIEAAF